jgi:hypothetical protein
MMVENWHKIYFRVPYFFDNELIGVLQLGQEVQNINLGNYRSIFNKLDIL